MFDVGFPELLLLAVVALVVVGPEQLPQLLRTLGEWIVGAKRAVTDVRKQIEDELNPAEIQREIEESSMVKEIREARLQLGNIAPSANESADPSRWPGMPPEGPDR